MYAPLDLRFVGIRLLSLHKPAACRILHPEPSEAHNTGKQIVKKTSTHSVWNKRFHAVTIPVLNLNHDCVLVPLVGWFFQDNIRSRRGRNNLTPAGPLPELLLQKLQEHRRIGRQVRMCDGFVMDPSLGGQGKAYRRKFAVFDEHPPRIVHNGIQ
jgi:hypothetical protein